MPSWLSGGAKKPEEGIEATPATTTPAATATPKDKDDDASSATGGADSDDNQVGIAVICFRCCFVPSPLITMSLYFLGPVLNV